jgi:hypothetical protein
MWPAPNFGTPNAEWVGKGGYYVLHTDNPELSAAIAMPHAGPGILPPYQERPKTWPVELKLSFDPKTDSGLFFPLLITLATEPAGNPALLTALNGSIPDLYKRNEDYAAHFFDKRLTAETPDAAFDRALRWAEISIDQGKVRLGDETGLIAGYYESGDSARPGYGWFFGRDSLWTSYAINSYGDFDLTRKASSFWFDGSARTAKSCTNSRKLRGWWTGNRRRIFMLLPILRHCSSWPWRITSPPAAM